MTIQGPTLSALLAEVSAAMGHIDKGGTAPTSIGGFRFVEETAVMARLKPLLDERGILLRPDAEQLRLDLYPRQGKDGPGCLATVTLALYAVRGTEEMLLARTVGQGADTQDKAAAKATTAAKKQALLIAFSIPTGGDPEAEDVDQRQARRRAPAPPDDLRKKMIGRLNQRISELVDQGRKDANQHSVRAHIKKAYGFSSLTDFYAEATEDQLIELGLYIKGKIDDDLPDLDAAAAVAIQEAAESGN